ncbi:MAG: YfiR family protein [Bacteroidales bacterium]|nr:YfiR family protein [Bacteroidales bacterium]
MRKVVKYIFLLILCIVNHFAYSQTTETELKVAYIERFTRFIEWPEKFENNTCRIAVIGKNPFDMSLDELFANVKIKNQNTELIYTDRLSDLTNANLVFISGSEKKRIKEILTLIGEKPILIISDTKGFCDMGTHINMFLDGKHIRFEINEEAIEKSGLKISSLLLASAKIVKTND